jgi:hypothetical protein
MKHLFIVLLIGLVACGNPRDPLLSQSNPPGSGQLSISGFVSMIQVTTAGTDRGPDSVVTVVTFIPQTPQAGTLGTLTFCGDASSDFVLNTFATANFTQGQGCSTIVSVQT